MNSYLDAVLAIGDLTYECGGTKAFVGLPPQLGKGEGDHYPAIGNHEYHKSGGTDCDSTGNGAGYRLLLGPGRAIRRRATTRLDLGSWHLIALNSSCYKVGGCGAGSPQGVAEGDLAAHPTPAARLFHLPASRPDRPGRRGMRPYGRPSTTTAPRSCSPGTITSTSALGPRRQDAAADPSHGASGEFVVGTGGRSLFGFSSLVTGQQPGSEQDLRRAEDGAAADGLRLGVRARGRQDLHRRGLDQLSAIGAVRRTPPEGAIVCDYGADSGRRTHPRRPGEGSARWTVCCSTRRVGPLPAPTPSSWEGRLPGP